MLYTVISNTGASAIAGRFHDLANGAIVTVNGDHLQASHAGGDRIDLTNVVRYR